MISLQKNWQPTMWKNCIRLDNRFWNALRETEVLKNTAISSLWDWNKKEVTKAVKAEAESCLLLQLFCFITGDVIDRHTFYKYKIKIYAIFPLIFRDSMVIYQGVDA